MKVVVKKKKGSGDKINKLIKKLEDRVKNDPSKVLIGIPQDIPYPDGTSLIMVAATNEFGSADGRVPERSFLRSTIVENKAEYKSFWKKNASKILTGETESFKTLSILGLHVESQVKSKIVELKTPANADSTIAAKGSSNPLVDSGHLVQSIRYEVRDDKLN